MFSTLNPLPGGFEQVAWARKRADLSPFIANNQESRAIGHNLRRYYNVFAACKE
jgi:hypothetical protein